MKVKTDAVLYSTKEVISKKDGTIYKVVGLLIDGNPKDFFTTEDKIAKSPILADFEKAGEPRKVSAEIEIKFSGKYTFVNLLKLG